MTHSSEKLAQSLEILQQLQSSGKIVIRSSDISRVNRERLLKNGFLQEVMRGWYIATQPNQAAGESTAWYASFWTFCSEYLRQRFKDDWCLSPELSLSIHVGNRTVPSQLIVRSPKGSNNITVLPHNTSILDIHGVLTASPKLDKESNLNIVNLPVALVTASPNYFRNNPSDARAALAMISDASEILPRLLDGGHSGVAGRLAGGFRNIGRDRIADDILKTMKAADFDCREVDPFDEPSLLIFKKSERSPYVNRLWLIWHTMRYPILKNFVSPPGVPSNTTKYLERAQQTYITDAYHSLSIEGYKVSRQLIEQVRLGAWNPESNERDREQRDALAAQGYWLAYQATLASVKRVLKKENAGVVADEGHSNWYRELFAPGVAASILRPADLAGYRSGQVYIRHSMHVPPNPEAVREMMPAFFDLLIQEKEPAVRVVLGHFIFVYIHPYMDGNGRMARFLMNTMLASGGYPWTVIPVERRDEYLRALEIASTKQDIVPFCKFISKLVKKTMDGKSEAK